MPRYALLIFAPTPADWADAPEEELDAHGAFGDAMAEAGIKPVAAFALQPSTTAKAVSNRGETVADGPFVDGGFVLSGYTVIEADSLDAAVELSKGNPATWRGGVEVRPLFEPPDEEE